VLLPWGNAEPALHLLRVYVQCESRSSEIGATKGVPRRAAEMEYVKPLIPLTACSKWRRTLCLARPRVGLMATLLSFEL